MNWDKISAKAVEVWDQIKEAWNTGVAALAEWDLLAAFEAWRKIPETIWNDVLAPIIKYFWDLLEPIRTAIENVYGIIFAPFKRVYDDIVNLFANIGTTITNAVSSAWTGAKAAAEGTSIPRGTGEEKSSGYVPYERGYKGTTPTTEFTRTRRDEMLDKWTAAGYSATGKNLTPGVLAAGRRAQLGDVMVDKATGKAYLVADVHGNRNPNVLDIYRKPEAYGARSGPKAFEKVGKVPVGEIPKTPEGVQSLLEKHGGAPTSQAPPSEGFQSLIKGVAARGAGATPPPITVTQSTPVTINGIEPGREKLVANEIGTALRSRDRQLIEQLKSARAYEARLGYI
jgi:hypothetical protein